MLSFEWAATAGHEKGPSQLRRGLLHARCRTLAHAPPKPADVAGNSGGDDARQRLHAGIRTSLWRLVKHARHGRPCFGHPAEISWTPMNLHYNQKAEHLHMRKDLGAWMTRSLAPPELLDLVGAYFRPRRVILFGSHARGEAQSDSDIDLLVVDDDTPAEKVTLKAGVEAQRAYPNPADVIPVREEIFRRKSRVPGTLSRAAALEGIVVYERP